MTILLLRHARAAFPDPGMSDFERPLSPDGVQGAISIGTYMARQKMEPDTILCSPAIRTVQTLAQLEKAGAVDTRNVIFEPDLYGGDVQRYFDLIREKAYGDTILIIGHNPMIEDVAFSLAYENNNVDALRTLEGGYPPAGLAVIDLKVDWENIAPDMGSLIELKLP